MYICHSFWSIPCLNSRFGVEATKQFKINLYCFATSLSYVHYFNYKIKFFGDKYSLNRFKILPYDEFIEINVPENALAQCWAQGKFYALQKMELGDIHIDGDVFMKSKALYDKLEENYDCIVQGIEDESNITWIGYDLARRILKDINFLNNCNTEKSYAYNVGVIGFKNQEFKDIYLNHYFDSLEKIKKLNLPTINEFIPDLILEQQHLYQISKNKHFKTNVMIGESELKDGEINEKLYTDAIDLGYQHILSSYKYQEFYNIREELKYINNELCEILDEYTKDIIIDENNEELNDYTSYNNKK